MDETLSPGRKISKINLKLRNIETDTDTTCTDKHNYRNALNRMLANTDEFNLRWLDWIY